MTSGKQAPGRTVSARTLALALLAAVTPTLWGSAIALSRIALGRDTLGWERGLFDWVSAPPAKLIQLVGYALIVAASLACLVAGLVVHRNAVTLNRYFGRFPAVASLLPIGVVALSGIAGLALFFLSRLIEAYGAFGLSALVFGRICAHVVLRVKRPDFFRPWIALLPLLIGAAPLCYALLFTPFRVPNEFLALPEETLLRDGRAVDNLRYINSSSFDGLEIPDPREQRDKPATFSVTLDRTRIFDLLQMEAFVASKPHHFWYEQASGRMEIHGPLEPEEYQFLRPFVQQTAEAGHLEKKFAADTLAELKRANRRYTAEELEFLRANLPELERQLVLGRFFYHHVFLFLPALSGVLDGKIASASQYGRGLTAFFSEALALFPEGVRFNVYLGLLYASYPFYLGLILLVAKRFGLSRWELVFVGAFTILAYLVNDIETTRLGVGLVPWRHFFDVVALLFLFLYARRPGAFPGALLAGVTGFSVYWSRETGLFLATAIVFALIVHAHVGKRRGGWVLAGLCLILAAFGWRLGDPRAATDLTVALLGINTPSLPPGFIHALAGVMIAAGLVWWLSRPSDHERGANRYADWVFLGAVLVYVAASGVYLLWYPRPHHLAPVLPTVGLALAVACRFRFQDAGRGGAMLAASVIAGTLGLVALLGMARSFEVWREARIFRNHVIHEWNFPYGRMVSTGQPELLRESIDLLRKHELTSSANILSPWEVVLLPFAGKYKDGPFMLSFDSLFSDNEVNKLASHLVTASSGALFVDTRILRGEYERALSGHAYMAHRIIASQLRIGAHASLRRAFEVVQPCYTLREEGRLISVYMRKAHARMTANGCRTDD